MKIKKLRNELIKWTLKGCSGTVFGFIKGKNSHIYEIKNIEYLHDYIEANTEGVCIELERYNNFDKTTIDYGTVLKIKYFDENIDTVMLIDNHTSGKGLDCSILNLSNKEIMADFKDLEDFKENVEIVEVLGQHDELFAI